MVSRFILIINDGGWWWRCFNIFSVIKREKSFRIWFLLKVLEFLGIHQYGWAWWIAVFVGDLELFETHQHWRWQILNGRWWVEKQVEKVWFDIISRLCLHSFFWKFLAQRALSYSKKVLILTFQRCSFFPMEQSHQLSLCNINN